MAFELFDGVHNAVAVDAWNGEDLVCVTVLAQAGGQQTSEDVRNRCAVAEARLPVDSGYSNDVSAMVPKHQ